MRIESITTADGTTASDPSSALPTPLEPPTKPVPSHLSDSKGRSRKKTLNANSGLTCLDGVDTLSVEIERNWLSCRLDTNYNIRDVSGDKVILKGVQDFNPFSFDSFKNVVFRDQENLPIARICFKQKSVLKSSMALAVYAPCDVLAGTGEETSGLFMFSSKFLVRNADGDQLFAIDYNNKGFSSSFLIKSVESGEEESTVVAKVLEKSRRKIRLQIISKMSITSKVMLLGLCVSLLHKFTPGNKTEE